MKRILTTVLVALALPAAAQDYSQLAAGAGLSRSDAQALSLTEIAAYKFNRDSRGDEQQAIVVRTASVRADPARHAQLIAAAGLTADEAAGLTLAELAAAKHNAGSRGDERIAAGAGGTGATGVRLAAAAGLDPAAAADLSLTEVAAIKFNRDTRDD
jgi:hypothetical protein